jgi:hypothetical protein
VTLVDFLVWIDKNMVLQSRGQLNWSDMKFIHDKDLHLVLKNICITYINKSCKLVFIYIPTKLVSMQNVIEVRKDNFHHSRTFLVWMWQQSSDRYASCLLVCFVFFLVLFFGFFFVHFFVLLLFCFVFLFCLLFCFALFVFG